MIVSYEKFQASKSKEATNNNLPELMEDIPAELKSELEKPGSVLIEYIQSCAANFNILTPIKI